MARGTHSARYLLLSVKLAVTGALLYWLLSKMDVAAVSDAMRGIGLVTLLLAIGIHAGAFSLMALRWWLLLRHTDPHIPFSKVFPSYCLGVFLGLVLPTGVGGDVARTAHLAWRGLRLRALVSSMIVDRVVGLISVMLTGAVSVLFLSNIHLESELRLYSVALIAVVAGATVLFFSPYPSRILGKFQGRRMPVSALMHIAQSCLAYRAVPRLLMVATGLSFAAQSLIILVYYVLSQALGLEVSLSIYFTIVPIVFLSMILPSLGGLGVREGVLVGLLLAIHEDGQRAITLSLVYLAVLWISSLPGIAVAFKTIARPVRNTPDAQ